jgi:hypothetical protein
MPDFTESFDARDWARALHVQQRPEIATDEGTMIGWFANALMRGWDEHARRTHPERSPKMNSDPETFAADAAPAADLTPFTLSIPSPYPPPYTLEDLYGALGRNESINLERLAATLAHSMQTSVLVVDHVNRQILKERAEEQAKAAEYHMTQQQQRQAVKQEEADTAETALSEADYDADAQAAREDRTRDQAEAVKAIGHPYATPKKRR